MILELLLLVLSVAITFRFLFRRRPVCGDASFDRSWRRPIRDVLADIHSTEGKPRCNLQVHDLRSPPLSGYPLKLLSYLYYTRVGKFLVRYTIKKSDLDCFENVCMSEPLPFKPHPPNSPCKYPSKTAFGLQDLVEATSSKQQGVGFRYRSIADFYSAYKCGRCTPVDVARAAICAIERSNESTVPPLRAVVAFDRQSVMKMAEASAERWKTGSTLSLLDGVPVSIKDDLKTDLVGYQCRIGNNFLPELCSLMENSNVVKKLCDAGAVIIGITNMPEFGCSSIGTNLNTNYQIPRNPHNTEYFTGGSSSGAAGSVAAGLCPVAIAGDGGGSGRVPASFCGLVSLKPTKGLVEETSYLGMISNSCFSPITASVLDTAIVMDVLCNGRSETLSLGQSSSLATLRVGVYWEWFEKADPENVAICKHALKQLQSLGVELKEIKIPEVEETRKALIVTVLTELSSLLKVDLDKHFTEIGAEAKLVIALGLQFSGVEVINALRQCTRTTAILNAIFDEVDLIATPTTGYAIPKITPDWYPYGKIDAKSTGAIDQYTMLASFAGIPAISIPVGFREESKIPVGLQLIAPMFQEKVLLQVAWKIESSGKFPFRKPAIWFDLLQFHAE